MPNYRRAYVPGGSYFFTLVTYGRQPIFDSPRARRLLGEAVRECQAAWPFENHAMVLLPDHLHVIWNLPHSDCQYSRRWSRIKRNFTQAWIAEGGTECETTPDQDRQGRRGIWQPRFWEHTIDDEEDFEAHFDYIHFNPVKHGYVRCPKDWPASTFHRWVERGVYDQNWACGGSYPAPIDDVQSAGEPT